MKKIKKFFSLLLSGSMMLTLLTGCWGGAGTGVSNDTQIKNAFLKAMTAAEGENDEASNSLESRFDELLTLFKQEGGGSFDVDGKADSADSFKAFYDEENNLYGMVVYKLPKEAASEAAWTKVCTELKGAMWQFTGAKLNFKLLRNCKIYEDDSAADLLFVYMEQPTGQSGGDIDMGGDSGWTPPKL